MAANLSIMNNILAASAVSAGLPLSSYALLCKPYCKLCNPNFMSSDSSETSQHNVIMDSGHVQDEEGPIGPKTCYPYTGLYTQL